MQLISTVNVLHFIKTYNPKSQRRERMQFYFAIEGPKFKAHPYKDSSKVYYGIS